MKVGDEVIMTTTSPPGHTIYGVVKIESQTQKYFKVAGKLFLKSNGRCRGLAATIHAPHADEIESVRLASKYSHSVRVLEHVADQIVKRGIKHVQPTKVTQGQREELKKLTVAISLMKEVLDEV